MLAVRLHQMRKVLGWPFEKLARHRPLPLTGPDEFEVLIAVCLVPRIPSAGASHGDGPP
jgi:hypothetical protein